MIGDNIGTLSTNTIDTGKFIYKSVKSLLDNKGWVYSKKNKKTGDKIELSQEQFDLEIEKAYDDYKKKAERVEAGQSINKNRVVDNLDDLDREFCKTWDKLLALYKRIMIRAYTIKEEKEVKK